MFRRLGTQNSTSSMLGTGARRRFAGAAAAPLAMLVLAAPAFSAEPSWSVRVRVGGGEARRPRAVACTPPPPRVQPHRPAPRCEPPAPVCHEVVPCDVSFSAYQSGCTVIVVATGRNTGSGFTTCFTSVDQCHGRATLTLRNSLQGGRCVAPVMSPFEARTSFRSEACLRSVEVVVAGRTYCVPVSHVRSL